VLNIRKPSPDIFAHALNLIRTSRESLRGANYENCVFLDDIGVNVKAAAKLVSFSLFLSFFFLSLFVSFVLLSFLFS
jgi:FMN phosphatase YigB (HAD superfamily)